MCFLWVFMGNPSSKQSTIYSLDTVTESGFYISVLGRQSYNRRYWGSTRIRKMANSMLMASHERIWKHGTTSHTWYHQWLGHKLCKGQIHGRNSLDFGVVSPIVMSFVVLYICFCLTLQSSATFLFVLDELRRNEPHQAREPWVVGMG